MIHIKPHTIEDLGVAEYFTIGTIYTPDNDLTANFQWDLYDNADEVLKMGTLEMDEYETYDWKVNQNYSIDFMVDWALEKLQLEKV